MPEASHVLRERDCDTAYDPGWGRTSTSPNIFYKHLNPPGLKNDCQINRFVEHKNGNNI
jgi:hypothetical protein